MTYFNEHGERLEQLFIEKASESSFVTTREELWDEDEKIYELISIISDKFDLDYKDMGGKYMWFPKIDWTILRDYLRNEIYRKK